MRLSGSQLLVKMLSAHGVRHVFGVPGDTGLAFYDALRQAQERGVLAHVLARDERSAAYMADAYARVSFRPGVCEAPSGAGAAYLAAGLAEPQASSIPVVALTSDTPLSGEYRNVLTALDQSALFTPVTKWRTLVKSAGLIPEAIRHAFRVATSGRPGAVHVALPMDVLSEEADGFLDHGEERCTVFPAYRVRPDPAAVDQAARLLACAKRPVIVAGGGAVSSGCWSELTALAETLGAPVGTSICGKGAIAEEHALSLGVVGNNGRRPYANALLRSADLILYVGTKTDSVVTDGWTLPRPDTDQVILHLDIDPAEIGRNYRTAVGLVGDAKLGLADLTGAVRSLGVAPRDSLTAAMEDEVSVFWAEFESAAASPAVPIKPQRVVSVLSRLLPADSIVVGDAGTPTPFLAAYFRSAAGRQVIIPRGLGGLGYAIPAVLGAKLARPQAVVVGLAGDGSFGMSAGELETLARIGLPVTVIHFNNGCFGWIQASQQLLHRARPFGVDFSADTDYSAIARGFGLQAAQVVDPHEVEAALRDALASDGPSFVDVVTASELAELPPVESFRRASRESKDGEGSSQGD